MFWGLLVAAGLALAVALFAVSRGEAGPATGTERLLSRAGAVGLGFLGLVWWYLGALAGGECEFNCPPDSVEHTAYTIALALAIVTVTPPTLKLLATALTGELGYANKTWMFVLVGVLAFVAWGTGVTVVFNATRPPYP
jgi:hypothetical protein